jgi:hypothetical protein
MILYTIQTEDKWNEFQKTGILKADDKIICCDDFIDSYAWMEKKMKELLPASDIDCKHPIWAWYKHCGKRVPDLRKSGHISKGEIGYRIKFEIENNKILLTDFSDWHLVLNRSEEDRLLEATVLEIEENDDLETYRKEGFNIDNGRLIYNWSNIILTEDSCKQDIQATLWYVKLEQVISVKKFKAR